MLIYANSFVFEPVGGPAKIILVVAKWVGQRARTYVDAARLAEGIRELKLKDGSTLTARATVSDERQITYPYLFCAQLSHRDEKVSGRKWITEVGVRQEAADKSSECSLLLKTDEVSALVTAPIHVTRPKLVEQLIQSCNPVGQTPGLIVKCLNEESAPAFLREVERDKRDYPIVLISPMRNAAYPVEPERLRSILVGLADVVTVPMMADTFAIQDIVSRRYIAFGGAINIIFPARTDDRRQFCETARIRPEEIDNILEGGNSIESAVLAVITHRTNLPLSWRQISQELVSQAILRTQLSLMIERAKKSDHSDELAEYIALLETADQELRVKDGELARMRSEYEFKNQEARNLQADIDNLKYALTGLQANDDGLDEVAELGLLRETFTSVLRGSPSLQQVLELISMLFANRIVILETAVNSAKESDRGGFRQGAKAYQLLSKLATEYWQVLADGKSDQHAKAVFGQHAFSANEASALSNDGKRRRTFSHRGSDFFMEKHLKHGVKDSLAETLRVHFEWLSAEKKILVGHCGKHLDF